ncbi:MAG: DUF3489 domain-containing protein [Rhizobiales bacterium]|jgi:hypothetical protein|nr:DUF3489 domain-containing protein [Hyphomicrobiales bacterium]
MSTTTKLSDTQLVILSQAAQKPDARVLPLPSNLQAKGGGVTRALKSLLKRGLIAEQAGSSSDEEWRRDESEAPLTLVITPTGRAAIGVEAGDQGREAAEPDAAAQAGQDEASAGGEPATTPGTGREPEDHDPSGEPARPGAPRGKGETITALLKQVTGATLAELTAATGWQAHSVRGFLSGTLKKKLGYTVESERGDDGVRRYRITA